MQQNAFIRLGIFMFTSISLRVLALTLIALLVASCSESSSQSDSKDSQSSQSSSQSSSKKLAPLVNYVHPEKRENAYTISGKGFVRASDKIALVSELAGIIDYVSPKLVSGARFDKGELIFRIEQETFQAEFKRAQASLKSAQVAREKAQINLDRFKTLSKDQLVAQSRLDEVSVNLSAAKASEQQAKAALVLAEEALADTSVKAPFDAGVISESVSLGEYVAPGQQLAEIFNTAMAEIVVGIAQNEAEAILRAKDEWDSTSENPLGLPVKVFPAVNLQNSKASKSNQINTTSEAVEGFVISVSPDLDPQSRTVDFIVGVPSAFASESGPQLLLGDFVEIELPAKSSNTIYEVPSSTIRKNQYIFLIDQNDKLKKTAVSVVSQVGKDAFINFNDSAGDFDADTRILETYLSEEADGVLVRPQGKASEASSEDADKSGMSNGDTASTKE